MKAMILCAGKGTRLRNLTRDTPKVLLPVGSKPTIDHVMDWLVSFGISDYVINLHHLGNRIQNHLEGRTDRVEYTHEPQLLGTAGGIKNAGPLLGDSFVVTFGDVITRFKLSAMLDFHMRRKALASIALAYNIDNRDHGVVSLDAFDRVLSFEEKPPYKIAGFYNAGTFVFEKRVLDYIPAGQASDLGLDMLPELIRLGLPVYGFRLPGSDYVIDVGTPKGYQEARSVCER